MLVDQLRGALAAKEQRESVEPGDHALELDAFDEEDGHRQFGASDAVEEMILQAQRSSGHRLAPTCLSYSSSSRLSPIPSALSFRWRAERSIPMNEAVRELLPEKRRI